MPVMGGARRGEQHGGVASGGKRDAGGGEGWARGISGRARGVGLSRASPGAGYHASPMGARTGVVPGGHPPGLSAADRRMSGHAQTRAALDAAQEAARRANPRDHDVHRALSVAFNTHAQSVLGDPEHPEHEAYQRSARIGEGILSLGPSVIAMLGGPAGMLAATGFNAMTGRGLAGRVTGGVMGPVPESKFGLGAIADWGRDFWASLRSGGGGQPRLRKPRDSR